MNNNQLRKLERKLEKYKRRQKRKWAETESGILTPYRGERNPSNRWGICAYCAKECFVERDHVFARMLFGNTLPNDVVVVDSCPKCNESFQKSDKYLHSRCIVKADTVNNQEAKESFERFTRDLQRPENWEFNKAFYADLKPMDTYAGAIYLCQSGGISISMPPIYSALSRMLKGIFFDKTKSVMDNWNIIMWVESDGAGNIFDINKKVLPTNDIGTINTVKNIVSILQEKPFVNIGSGKVISYKFLHDSIPWDDRLEEKIQFCALFFTLYENIF